MSLRQYQVGLHLLPLGNLSGLARLAGVEGVALLMGARWNVNPGENMGKNLQIRQGCDLPALEQVTSLPIVASQQHFLRITQAQVMINQTTWRMRII